MLLEQVPMSGNENKESSRAALKGVTIIRRQLPRPASAKTSSREWIGRKKGRASEASTACPPQRRALGEQWAGARRGERDPTKKKCVV